MMIESVVDKWDQKIDLNQASAVQLQTLPGIGPKLARRIIENRSKKGPFSTVDSLARVRGIGPKTVDKLRERVVVSKGQPR